MRSLRYILVALTILSYRGLSAQEFDLYDFRYYKRFESAEELLAPEIKDTITFTLNRKFSTRALDYNLSFVRYSRRGIPLYRRKTTLNGVEIPFLSRSAIRDLQIDEYGNFDETRLHIDTLKESKTAAGFYFSSKEMPYSLRIHSAHKLNKGWALAANIDAKTGRDLHIDGLFGNSLRFNTIATKEFKNRHLVSMALFANPHMRSVRLASTKEAFQLKGNNLYNPAWGYQDGKVRSSRIRRGFLPTIFIGYEGEINKQHKIDIAAATTIGVERYSSLDWFNAQTPAPDNYRYMPSYFTDEDDIFSMVESAWLTDDPHYTQIDFDKLYRTNRLNGGEAVYAISDRVRCAVESSLHAAITTTLKKGHTAYGIDVTIQNNRNYKQMRDLLDAEYIIDLDYFLQDDETFGNSLQNNLAMPNRRIKEGDRFGYDYAIRRHDISLFGSYRYSNARTDLELLAKLGYSDISRRGFYRKELYRNNSYGVSRHIKFSPFEFRAKGEYLVADNHLVRGEIALSAKPHNEEDYFLQSQYNNRIVATPAMRTTYSGEVQYTFQRPNFSFSTTLFLSGDVNDTEVRHLYDDLSSEYSDIVASKIDRLRYGLEVEAEYRFANNFRAIAAVSVARYKYADNALITIYSDASNIILANHVISRIKGLSLGNMPQIVATAGLSYYNRGWFANLNLNYAGFRYIDSSLTMRTERALHMATSPEQRKDMISQERLRDAFTTDISLSKTLYLSRLSKRIYSTKAAPRFEDRFPRSRLVFRIGVRNIFGSGNIIYNGYESSRMQRYKLADEYIYSRQASRYLYAYPRTFYASATFAF